MADPFATPAELASYLQTATQAEADAGSADVLDTGAAALALASASGAIREVCGWSITQETVTGDLVTGWHGGALFLQTLYLTSVALSVGAVPLVAGADFTWTRYGTVTLTGRSVWVLSPMLLTYTHGYPTVPDAVRDVCLEQAAQRYLNPERLASRTIGSMTEVRHESVLTPDLASDFRLASYRLPAGVA